MNSTTKGKQNKNKKGGEKSKKKNYDDISFFDNILDYEGNIRIFENDDTDELNLFAIITIGSFAIKVTLRYYEDDDGNERYFVSYPSYKNKKKKYVNTSYCFDEDTIDSINEAINNFLIGE